MDQKIVEKWVLFTTSSHAKKKKWPQLNFHLLPLGLYFGLSNYGLNLLLLLLNS